MTELFQLLPPLHSEKAAKVGGSEGRAVGWVGGGGGGEEGGDWVTELEVFRRRLDLLVARNRAEGRLDKENGRSTRVVGTGEEEEVMLLEALEMQQASSESRQARGLGRNSENSVHRDSTGQIY